MILAQAHDRRAALAAWREVKEAPYHGEFDGDSGLRLLHALLDLELGDFNGVLSEAYGFDAACARAKPVYSCTDDLLRQIRPALAIAYAEKGAFPEAHRIVDTTPVDCDLCISARSRIDALQHHWSGAAFWYAQAVKFGPSLPQPETDWGAMLLAKGDTDAAIAKFTLAHANGPHFADPLEMWGEALMLKNRSDLALAKFENANKYAPNWGRLHLKWGEALFYVGRTDEAQSQFAEAAQLDLSESDQRALAIALKRR
jgi:tetratricopeptide (TPR) repeat protein